MCVIVVWYIIQARAGAASELLSQFKTRPWVTEYT